MTEKKKDLTTASLSMIKRYVLGKSIIPEYEDELIRRITMIGFSHASEKARAFFLTEYSDGLLNYVALEICHIDREEIDAEYYTFISQENYYTHVPYYKLALYKRKNNATLLTYVSTITVRYFKHLNAKRKKKEIKFVLVGEQVETSNIFSDNGVIENPWFPLYIQQNDESNEITDKLISMIDKLPYREQLVIKLMVMGNASGADAFEVIAPYLNPEKPISEFTRKNKQDAMSLLKGRALKHLKKLYDNEKDNN